jgi:hypothetical protein
MLKIGRSKEWNLSDGMALSKQHREWVVESHRGVEDECAKMREKIRTRKGEKSFLLWHRGSVEDVASG